MSYIKAFFEDKARVGISILCLFMLFVGIVAASASESYAATGACYSCASSATGYIRYEWSSDGTKPTSYCDAPGWTETNSSNCPDQGEDDSGEISTPTYTVYFAPNNGSYGKVSVSYYNNVPDGTTYSSYKNNFSLNDGLYFNKTVVATAVDIDGYTTKFSGWSMYGSTVDGVMYGAVHGNMTFIANFERTANEYIVLYDCNTGYAASCGCEGRKNVLYDSTYGDLCTPTYDGYKFVGWYDAFTGGNKITSSTKVAIAEGHTLFAHWEKIVEETEEKKVILDYNDGSGNKDERSCKFFGSSSCTIYDLPTPTRDGYSFEGWSISSTSESGDKTSLTVSKNSVSSTFYAIWKLDSSSENKCTTTKTYYVTAPSGVNCGSDASSSGSVVTTYRCGESISVCDSSTNGWMYTPVKGCYLSSSYLSSTKPSCTSSNGNGSNGNTDNNNSSGDGTSTSSREVTVYYTLNGGTLNGSTTEVTDTCTISGNESSCKFDPPTPTKENDTFLGWRAANETTCQTGDLEVTKNTRYYACWQSDYSNAGDSTPTYKALYELDGGTLPGNKDYGQCTVKSGEKTCSIDPPTPTKDGYTFGGWRESNETTCQTGDLVLSQTTRYHACWNKSVSSSESSSDSIGTYKALYEAEGGILPNNKTYDQCTVKSGEKTCSIDPPTPTRDGYTFGGWRESNKTTCQTGDLVLSQTTRYHACWNKINSSGGSNNNNNNNKENDVIDDSPDTGTIGMVMILSIGLGALGYSIYHFRDLIFKKKK